MSAGVLLAVTVALAMVPCPVSAATLEARRLELPIGDVVRTPDGDVYVSVRGRAGPEGNSVRRFDPQTLRFDPSRTLFVGSEPGRMAVDRYGTVLYVALDGAASIRRIQLDTFTSDLLFPLGIAPDRFGGPLFAIDLTVLPGSPGTVAVARSEHVGFFAGGTDLAIYDDGVPRHQTTSFDPVTLVAAGSAGTRVYGYDGATSEQAFKRYAVDGDGVALIDATPELVGSATDIVFAGDRVYSTTGRIVDPETRTLVTILQGIRGYPTAVSPDLAANRLYLLDGNALRTYDLTSFSLLDTTAIVGLPGDDEFCCEEGIGRDLVHVGTDRFVFRTVPTGLVVVGPSFGACEHDDDCRDTDACTDERCTDGTCSKTPVVCGDGQCVQPCNPKRGCDETLTLPDAPCADEGDPCTDDRCDAQGQCMHRPIPDASYEALRCHIDRLATLVGATGCTDTCRPRLDDLLNGARELVESAPGAETAGACAKDLGGARKSSGKFLRTVGKLHEAGVLTDEEAGGLQIASEVLLGLLLDPRDRCRYRPGTSSGGPR